MALADLLQTFRNWRPLIPARRASWKRGGLGPDQARLLADAERAGGGTPPGCAWLDERTIRDLDLGDVFPALDRTLTPTGAQVLWRWVAAPAVSLDVLTAREHSLQTLAARPPLRDELAAELTGQPAASAPHVPRLLWEAPPAPMRIAALAALALALVVLAAGAWWWPILLAPAVVVAIVNLVVDDWASLRQASHAHALGVLERQLAAAARILARDLWPAPEIGADLDVLRRFRRRIRWLTFSDPLGLSDALRGAFLIRVLLVGRAMRAMERERARLCRVVLWLGELDALVAIATLRAERADACVPELSTTARPIEASGLVHPAIAGAVANDLALDAGLLITGSNMSGKSTFLRTIALNAILAQSIHTTFGRWRAGLCQVRTVLRVVDAPSAGLSKYAVEVEAVGQLLEAAARRAHGLPWLFLLDEPFSGTNPAVRVPIVVAVLDELGQRDFVVAATHDLEVADRVDGGYARGYFADRDDIAAQAPRHKLRPGIASRSNAIELLRAAGYPSSILDAVQRGLSEEPGHAPSPDEANGETPHGSR